MSPPPATVLGTARLDLRPLSATDAADILAGIVAPGRVWAPDYPAQADVVAATAYLWALEHVAAHAPWGPYQLVRRADGSVIGGAGFRGRPLAGEVEIAYAVVPSARGEGYATEAVGALVTLAGALGVRSVFAVLDAGNRASRGVVLAAGFRLVGSDGGSLRFARTA